ncbi:M12 family metallo-peptidase [uncultured Brevundimonas sp.]|uniref:M12 family metallo-peptidase n=1 Tax=uncultured Brevundimonas sp. TaxID=213418 RepID=UPI0030ED4476|tara:strand:- start:3964 stop:5448 length:1485 start_codon:yes stop_codon:yes gene_type:complete
MFLAWLSVALFMIPATQDAQLSPTAETRLVVSGADAGVDDAASRQLQNELGVLSVDQTSVGPQIWTLPDDRVQEAFTALQASGTVDAVDYAGDDYRTLFIDVAETFLNPIEHAQLETIKTWPGVEEVRVQRTRRDGLSASVLRQGFGRIDGMAAEGAFLLDLPGRPRFLAKGAAVDTASGAMRWRGDVTSPDPLIAPGQTGDAFLTLNEGIEGSVVVGEDLFLFSPLGERGVQTVAHFKVANLPRDHAAGSSGGIVPGEGAPFVELGAALPDQPPIISVGIVWTAAAETEARKWGRHISDVIQSTIDQTNYGLERSGATFRLELVGSRAISGSESGNFQTDALALANRSDRRWDDVHAWRDQTRSDVVILVRSSIADHCGEAVAINADEGQAFAVVSYFCTIATHTIPHEIGHLLGGRHIRDNTTTTTPAYARGYLNGEDWRTIMVEDGLCNCGRINHWANPNVRYQGVATGVANQNHDLRVMNANAARVAAYR